MGRCHAVPVHPPAPREARASRLPRLEWKSHIGGSWCFADKAPAAAPIGTPEPCACVSALLKSSLLWPCWLRALWLASPPRSVRAMTRRPTSSGPGKWRICISSPMNSWEPSSHFPPSTGNSPTVANRLCNRLRPACGALTVGCAWMRTTTSMPMWRPVPSTRLRCCCLRRLRSAISACRSSFRPLPSTMHVESPACSLTLFLAGWLFA